MAYNVKLSPGEIERIAFMMYKNAQNGLDITIARTFSAIMCNSPRLKGRYDERLIRGEILPAKVVC